MRNGISGLHAVMLAREVSGFEHGVLVGVAGGSGVSLPGIVLGNYAKAHMPDWVLRTILATPLLVVRGRPVL